MQRSMWPDERAGTVYGDAAIHYSCRRATHLAAPSRAGRGGLIVHRGKWAYCDGAVSDRDHEWAETGGVPIDKLIDWAKAMGPWRATTVRR